MSAEEIECIVFAVEAQGVRLDLIAGTGYWCLDGTLRHAEALDRIAGSLSLTEEAISRPG